MGMLSDASCKTPPSLASNFSLLPKYNLLLVLVCCPKNCGTPHSSLNKFLMLLDVSKADYLVWLYVILVSFSSDRYGNRMYPGSVHAVAVG